MLSEIWRCSPSDWLSEWVSEWVSEWAVSKRVNIAVPRTTQGCVSTSYMSVSDVHANSYPHRCTGGGGGGGVSGCHILNHSNWAYMYMYMAACLGMSKKKQLTCWRCWIFCSLWKFNVFTCCYVCVACKIIFPHKLYPFSSFISWWIKSHTSNFSFSPLNRVDVCRERFFYSKLICKGKQSIFTIITSCKS